VSLPVIFYAVPKCIKNAATAATFFDLFKELEKIRFENQCDLNYRQGII
jgi:hypothetical protein